jgi:hypothetical protein
MIRVPLLALLGFACLTACAEGGGAPSAPVSAQQLRCEAEQEAARAEAGFQLQAVGTDYAGSDEAALAQDMRDARVANEIATAAFAECMAGR